MPELPEVETVVRGLKRNIHKNKITKVSTHISGLRIPIPEGFCQAINKRYIVEIKRKAKYIVMRLEHKLEDKVSDKTIYLVTHLGMSGRMTIQDANYKRKKHDHVVLDIEKLSLSQKSNIQGTGNEDKGSWLNANDQSLNERNTVDGALVTSSKVVLNDPRRFGLITALSPEDFANFSFFKKLGMEPLTKEFNPESLFKMCSGRSKNIKTTIMDSSLVVGVGNIYASESLFLARINPEMPAGKLTKSKAQKLYEAIVVTLKDAIKAGGSTLRDYAKADGNAGYFQHQFNVYDQAGQPCRVCGTHIKQIRQANRSTYFCPKCQKI